MDQAGGQRLLRVENAWRGDQVLFGLQFFDSIGGALGYDACVQLQVVIEAHRIFGHARVVNRALHMPVEGVEQEFTVLAGGSALTGQEDDIAHGFHGAEVMGMHRNRQGQ